MLLCLSVVLLLLLPCLSASLERLFMYIRPSMYMKSFVTYVVVYCQKNFPFSPASWVASLYVGGGGGGGNNDYYVYQLPTSLLLRW